MKSYKPIQRSLIVSYGEVAEKVHHYREQAPHPAVAHLAWPASEDEVITALQTISRTGLQAELTQQGWQLIRPDEITLFLIWDVNDHSCTETAADIAESIDRITQQRFVVHTATLLITLSPQPDDPIAQQQLQQLAPQSFGRGVFHLSRINELGLQLEDEEALARTCNALMHVLLFTPLRELPEWAAEHSATIEQEHAVGLATWSWSPQTVRQRLAYRWAAEVLAIWLETDSGPVQLTPPSPEQLSDILATPLPPVSLERWQAPHPWVLHELLEQTEPPPLIDEQQLEAVENRFVNTLEKVITAALDEQGAPQALLAQLEAVQEMIDRFQEQNEARRLVCEGRQTSAGSSVTTARQRLETLLQKWPKPTALAWLKAIFSPWRWPQIGLRYWQIQEAGRAWEKLQREQVRWTQQVVVEEATKQLYHRLQILLQKRINEVDELLSMLTFVRNQLQDEAAEFEQFHDEFPPLGTRHYLYDRLVPDSVAQAAVALQRLDGLSTHMDDLDAQPLLTLPEIGYEQLEGVHQLTAAEMVRLTHSTDEQLHHWWETLFNEAAPLWRNPTAYLSETPARPLFVACGADIATLETQLTLTPGDEHGRWLNSNDLETIYLLRLRAGIALAQRS